MLTVQLIDAAKANAGLAEVEIICDAEGLSLLARQLEFLKKGSTHAHLKTPSWAGSELTEDVSREGAVLVNHLRITMMPSR